MSLKEIAVKYLKKYHLPKFLYYNLVRFAYPLLVGNRYRYEKQITKLETRCTELFLQNNEFAERLAKSRELLKFWVNDFYDAFNNQSRYEARHKALVETEQFLKEE